MIEARKPTGMRASRRGRVAQRAQDRRGVDDRVGVGHRDDRAEAAGGGGAGAGLEVLLVLLAGRAQVHVRVDEAGEQVAPVAVDDLGALGRLERAGRADLGDLAAAHEHVVRRVDARRAGRARARRGPAGRRGAARGGRAGSCARPPTGHAAAVRRGRAPASSS